MICRSLLTQTVQLLNFIVAENGAVDFFDSIFRLKRAVYLLWKLALASSYKRNDVKRFVCGENDTLQWLRRLSVLSPRLIMHVQNHFLFFFAVLNKLKQL